MVTFRFTIVFFMVAAGFGLLGCAKNLDGGTSFREASKGFEKELPAKQREQTIKALQAETTASSREARTTDRTVTPVPPQVVTPVNPSPTSQLRD
jgi:hypothetical protein